jgi:alcohol dehydrogenase
MQAVVLYEHGGPDKLVYEAHFPDPRAEPGEVILRVKAASLNYHDVFTRQGMPGIKLKLPVIIGLDLAGDVVELGPGVTDWAVGERVLVDPVNRVQGGLMGETMNGGLAEYCRVAAHQLIRLPEGVSYAAAAALPVAYGTAHRMMLTQGRIAAGEKIFLLGASGGVGTCCIFLSKMVGAEVVAGGSNDAKLQKLRALGADQVINYASHDFVQAIHALYGKPHRRSYSGGVDVVVNYTGGDTWAKSLRCLRRGGRMLTCGATAGFDPQTDIRYIWTFELHIIGANGWERGDLEALLTLVQTGKMHPVIDQVLPLHEAREGIRLLEEREVIGKVIVTP